MQTVDTHMPRRPEEPEPHQPNAVEPTPATEEDFPVEKEPAYREASEVGPEITQTQETPWWTPAPANDMPTAATPAAFEPAAEQSYVPDESLTGGAYFCGDTRFFSLNRALQIIATQKLTGTLRFFWDKQPVELWTQSGQVLFATSRDSEVYCTEPPVTLSNVAPDRLAPA